GSNQCFDANRLALHLGALKDPFDHVRLDRQAFEFAQTLRVRINPFYHFEGLLIGLGVLCYKRSHLIGLGGEGLLPHQLPDNEPQGYSAAAAPPQRPRSDPPPPPPPPPPPAPRAARRPPAPPPPPQERPRAAH